MERGFSAVTNLLTTKRNRLDFNSRGNLRLTLTKLTPNVEILTYCLCYFIYSSFYVTHILHNKYKILF
nr:unnamed protein product [Callosobruchus chinensis]